MIVDYAIHDKGDGNPHAHILLTMRAMDENGKWLPKARKVYDLDENGERIRLPSGECKSHKENTTDWDQKTNAECWRSKWAEVVNRCYEKNGFPIRVDLRSFERQGKEQLPTIHLGPAVAHMEEKGIHTELGDYNRQIKEHNKNLSTLRKSVADLSYWLNSIQDEFEDTANNGTSSVTILDYIRAYNSMRKDERTDWGIKGKQTASVNDLKFSAQVFNWMQETGISTLEDFRQAVSGYNADFSRLSENRKAIRQLDTTLKHIDTITRLKPIYDQSKRGFDKAKIKYAGEHKEDLEQFQKAVRYMKANKLNASDREKYAEERSALIRENDALEQKLQTTDFDPEFINRVRYCVDKVIETGAIPEHTPTIIEKMRQTPTETKTMPYENRRQKEQSI